MNTRRPELIKSICEQVGLPRRVNERSPYLTKRELLQIHGWIALQTEKNRRGAGDGKAR